MTGMERGGLDETRGEVVRRRLRTVPPVVLGLVLVTALFPALLVLAVVVDLVRWIARRTPWMATRLLCFLWVYLAGETLGLAALLGLWVAAGFGRRGAWLRDRTWAFQQRWAAWMFGAARRLFGLRVVVTGDDVVAPGPAIVLIRHASIVDNLLPANLVARPHGLRLRYVLKRELLSDPCLDVAGKRLPNYFVRRGTGARDEVARVRALAEGLGPVDGVLIYPEGTRFTEERRRRAIARIAEHDPALAARAERIEHLLPPRTGGTLALLDGAPGADVVVLAHHGFDGLRLVSDIWRGALVGRTITVRFTRIPRAEIPAGRAERVAWLYETWQAVDAWVAAMEASAAARPARPGRPGRRASPRPAAGP